MRGMLTLQARQKLVRVEGVHNLELLALREQLCELVGSLFHLPDDCAPDNSWAPNDDCELVILGPNSVVDINKVAKHLTTKQTASRTRLGIRSGNQTDVEARPVGAIDDRGFPAEPEEKLSTVSTLAGVFMQGNTPVAAPVNSAKPNTSIRKWRGRSRNGLLHEGSDTSIFRPPRPEADAARVWQHDPLVLLESDQPGQGTIDVRNKEVSLTK